MLDIQRKLDKSFYFLLSLPATAMGFALCIQISTLSWKLDALGLTAMQVGVVWSAGPIAGIIGQLLFGVISDKAWFMGGRRKPFIIIGGILTSLMVLALAQLETLNEAFPMLGLVGVAILVALTLDLSINISFNPTRTIIADVTPEGAARTRGYTWMQFISGFFGVLAYFIGALLGKDFLFYSGAILVLVFTIIPAMLIKEPRELGETAEETEAVASTTDWPMFTRLLLAHSFTWLGVQSMFIYFYQFLKARFASDMGGTESGIFTEIFANVDPYGRILDIGFMILNVVGFLLPLLVFEPLSRKYPRVRIHFLCMLIMSVGYFLIASFGNSASMIYLLMAVVGIGWAAVVSLPFAIMSEMVDKTRMGLFMGIFNLSVVIPQLVASYGVGMLVDGMQDKGAIFLICGSSLAISAILWLTVKEKQAL